MSPVFGRFTVPFSAIAWIEPGGDAVRPRSVLHLSNGTEMEVASSYQAVLERLKTAGVRVEEVPVQ